MKKSILFFLAICLLAGNPVTAQKSGLLKKVANSMADELLGKSPKPDSDQPEPVCACNQAEVVMAMGEKLQLDYKELTISILDDGSILAKRIGSDEFYIIKDGVTQGPITSGDPGITAFEDGDDEAKSVERFLLRNKPYITRSGEKLLITFGGKSYGPYAQISIFVVSKSKDKFAALVIENVVVNEDQGKKMDEAIKNAKSEQEKMDLAMKYAQEMQQKMTQGGGPMNTLPKLVTNIPDATFDPLRQGINLSNNIKYDDILSFSYDKVYDLKGDVLVTVKQEFLGAEELFVNTTNTKYASYNYGTLTFSDNKTLSELFNPHLIKDNGQVYLAYMYYSPKKNSIMQCKIVF
jgi:hypothetical protein